MTSSTGATILNGLILGWSVASPPGPINAEMIRRHLSPPGTHGKARRDWDDRHHWARGGKFHEGWCGRRAFYF